MIVMDYIIWHFSVALFEIGKIMRNFLVSTWHRFLIVRHLRTLFSPWHRLQPSQVGRTKGIGDRIANIIMDIYIRILASIVRIIIVLFGLLAEIIIFVAFVFLFVFWVMWPYLFVRYIIDGLLLIF